MLAKHDLLNIAKKGEAKREISEPITI